MSDTEVRSLAKSITWRVLAIVITFVVLLIVFDNCTQATLSTIIIHTLKTALYYGHERLWNKITWGVKHEVRR